MMRLRLIGTLALSLVAACTHVSTQGPAAGARHDWTIPDTLRIASAISPNSLNPILESESAEAMFNSLVFSQLVTFDTQGAPVPELASVVPSQQNGGISKDGLTITYKLRHGVTWHDGAPFTSKDVAFSFHAVMNPNNNVASRTGYDLVKSVETPDAYTVVFHMKQRYAPVVSTLFGLSDGPLYVIPEHLLAKYPNLNTVAFNANPVGTGPFRFVKWIRGDRMEFEAYDRFFRGKPGLRQIIVRFVPDENTEVNQLRTHEIDWLFRAGEETYAQIAPLKDIRVVLVPSNEYRGMLINTEHPIVNDVRVRRAIAYAIDKKAMTDKVTYGSAVAATEDLPSFMWAYDPHVQTYPFDPAKAKQLLADAGWRPGPDGVLEKDGKRLSLLLVLRQGAAADTSMSVMIQAWLRAVGIELEIKTFPGATLFAPVSGVLPSGRYDVDLSGFASGIDPDNSAQFLCGTRAPNGYNWSRYCNPEMDAAQAMAVDSFDPAVRKRAYARIEGLLARDVPQIFIYWSRGIHPVNPDFKNFAPGPNSPAWNAYAWKI